MTRCAKTDLPADQCAHCAGVTLPTGHDWTTTNPQGPAPAAPYREPRPQPRPPRGGGVRFLTELDDLYPRLFESLPADSRPKSNDNAAAYAGAPDPRKAPVRVEVLDLITRIEADVPECARIVAEAMGGFRCVAFPHDSANGAPEVSPRVDCALDTLAHHWRSFEAAMPEVAAAIEENVVRLIATARRLVGETMPPVPLASPCPECGSPTVFRIETERGQIAVCGNPVCRDECGRAHQWTETEWEDAHPRRAFTVHRG